MNRKEKILIYGALLHDIGKVIQRNKGMAKKHANFSKDFVKNYGDTLGLNKEEKEKVMELVNEHHSDKKSDELLNILKEADHLSARSDRDEINDIEIQNIQKTPLLSIFSEISLDGKESDKKLYDSVIPLSTNLEDMPHEKKAATIDYKKIVKELKKDWYQISKLRDLSDKVDTLNYVLLKNLKFVPSAIFKTVPDIPLYDHLKTTAAIALSLYRSESEKPFLLVGGEISGIQKYIFYNINEKESDRGAAKRYRGRSFMIGLITDSVVRYILHSLDLYEFSVLVNTAGHFMILAPNTKHNKNKLEEIRDNVNNYIVKKEFPEIYMSITWMACKSEDIYLNHFKDTLKKFYYSFMGGSKIHKFSEIIAINKDFFKDDTHIYPCSSCGRNTGEKDKRICDICESIEKIGGKLVKGKYLARKIGNYDGDWVFEYGNTFITYKIEEDVNTKISDWEVLSIKDISFPMIGKTRGFKIYGSFAPIESSGMLSFTELAQIGKSLKERSEKGEEEAIKLGMFKADVDNLGEIFKRGIKELSISRYSHLSFMFDIFFGVKGVNVAKENNIYLLFAGGDDLIALGRYDEILNFSIALHNKFADWCGNNPAITISGGISIADVKFPVGRLRKYAKKELDNAKENQKNRLSIFSKAIPWKFFEKQIELACKLEEYRQEGLLSSGFSNFLINLYDKSKQVKGYTMEIINPTPYLVYYLRRNFKRDKNLGEKLIDDIIDNNTFPYIRIGASIWSLNKRYFKKNKEV